MIDNDSKHDNFRDNFLRDGTRGVDRHWMRYGVEERQITINNQYLFNLSAT